MRINVGHRLSIKRLLWLLWFLIGIGLSVALIAKAQLNNQSNTTLRNNEYFDENTIREGIVYAPIFPDTLDYPDKVEPVVKKAVRVAQSNSGFYKGLPLVCWCAEWLKRTYGFNIGSIGTARNWPRNSTIPVKGGVTITSESFPGTFTGHVVYNKELLPEGILTDEVNLIRCTRTSRIIPYNYAKITGYYDPNN